MLRGLQRAPGLVFAVLAAYFLLQAAIRVSLSQALELDEAQQIFLAQWLAVGYDSQPPFYNWIQYAVSGALGASLFSLAIVKNGMLFLSYLFYGLAAWRLIGRKELAMLAPLGLLTVPQIGFEAQRDLTHTVAVIFAACFFLYGIVRTIEKPTAFAYLLTGAAIGIGLTAKYNFALLPAAALVAIALDADMRRRLLDWRILLTAAATLAIVLPHALWFLDNISAATDRTISKLVTETDASYLERIATGIGTLLISSVGFGIITLVVFAVCFGPDMLAALRASSRWTRFCERLVLTLFAVLVVTILAGGIDSIRDRWLTPYLLILPLYLCLKLDAAGFDIRRGAEKVTGAALIAMILIPTILVLRVVTASWSGHYQYLNIPFPQFAAAIEADLGTPAAIITDNLHLAGNMRVRMPDVPAIMPQYAAFRPAIATDRPVVVVWMGRRDQPLAPVPEQAAAYAREVTGRTQPAGTRILALPYSWGRAGDSYDFAYAWYDPL